MITFMIFLLIGGVSTADVNKQDPYTGGFTLDQHGKYVFFYQEEGSKEMIEADFRQEVANFFKEQQVDWEDDAQTKILVKGKTFLKKNATLGNYVSGVINYDLVFEKQADGYRYWFTNMTYAPYLKDRYGKLVPAKVSPIPLEKEMTKLNQASWNKQRDYAYQAIDYLSKSLNKHLDKSRQPKMVPIPQ